MNILAIIDTIRDRKRVSKTDYADRLGISIQNLNKRMKSGNMSISRVSEMLYELGYVLEVVPLEEGETYYVDEWED